MAPNVPFTANAAPARQDAPDALSTSATLPAATQAARAYADRAVQEAANIPEIRQGAARAIGCAGVIGGGTMGAGIAVAMLDAGLNVVMVEQDAASLARGRARVEAVYDRLIMRDRLTAANKIERMARFNGACAYAALSHADVIVEAVFEDMAVKTGVFTQIDRFAKPGAILATNTSYLDIDRIAQATGRPEDVLGLHFFSPANIMQLLEVVVAARTAPDVVATAFALARRLGKTPVRAGVCDGFIGNRILAAYRHAADLMLEDGASPYDIDAAVRAFGYPMGPFQVVDLAGGDIGWATRKRRAPARDPAARYVEIADRLCEQGWFGQKTGRGFYRYAAGDRTGTPDPEVLAIVDAERRRTGRPARAFDKVQIVRRYMAAMVNEAANVLHEGIARQPSDVDAVFLAGYGFPRDRGGPLWFADTVGAAQILADIQSFASEDPTFWRPSPLLRDLARRQTSFASLNTTP